MANEPLPPDPEQIVPAPPTSRTTLIGLAVALVVVLVGFVLVIKWMNRPASLGDTSSLPVLGEPNAPLTIYEYASFTCERCAQVRPMVKEVLSRYPGQVKVAFIHLPQGPPVATQAAIAGLCAQEQGKFWEFADLMFERQASWYRDPNPLPLWLTYASQAGMDTNRLAQCLNSEQMAKTIQQQAMMAAGQVIQSTPTFLIGNSRLPQPRSVDDFVRLIDKELAAQKKG